MFEFAVIGLSYWFKPQPLQWADPIQVIYNRQILLMLKVAEDSPGLHSLMLHCSSFWCCPWQIVCHSNENVQCPNGEVLKENLNENDRQLELLITESDLVRVLDFNDIVDYLAGMIAGKKNTWCNVGLTVFYTCLVVNIDYNKDLCPFSLEKNRL